MSGEKPRVTIYTDGGADPNPGPGGWGAILIHEASGRIRELSGGEPHTTNNRMELTAAIRALETLKRPCIVTLYTDSEYLQRGITEWLPDWQKRGWRRKRGGDIQNLDLWQRLAELIEEHEVRWEWVRGHAGNPYNERADALATREIRAHYAAEAEELSSEGAEVFLLVSARGGEGWWGAMIRSEGEERILFGHEPGASANRLDILAATAALEALPEGVPVRIYTHSDYLRNGATRWIRGWRRCDWRTKSGEPVRHRDAWERLDAALKGRRVEWPPVKDEPLFEFEDLAERLREEIEELRRGAGYDEGDT